MVALRAGSCSGRSPGPGDLSITVSPATLTCAAGGTVGLVVSVPGSFDRSRPVALSIPTGARLQGHEDDP
jgi:hypothetical protein